MHRSYGVKSLVLLLAALGVMAVSAAAAQASFSAGLFLVGNPLTNVTGLHSVNVEQEGTGELLSEIGIEIECQEAEIENGNIHSGGAVTGSVLFDGCAVIDNVVCSPYPTLHDLELETNHGLILASGSGQVVLHGGNHYVRFSGSPFVEIYNGDALGELGECNLEDNHFAVAGSVAFQILNPLTGAATHALHALLNGSLLLSALTYGNAPAELHGLVNASVLGGANWAVH